MSNLYFDPGLPDLCPSELKGYKKVLLATPSYGNPDASYTYAMANSISALAAAGIKAVYLLLEGNCHVDDARNTVVRHFRASDCDELVFLDADVSWEPDALLQLCRRDFEVVGAVYPFRRASENMPMRLLDQRFPDKDGMLELEGLPTGFLKLKRSVFDKMEPHVPWYWDKTEKTPQFFGRNIHEDNQRWGGDIEFCNRWYGLGGKIYADTEIRLGHAAKVIYRDSLAAYLRRHTGITLKYILPLIRDGIERLTDYSEIFEFYNNQWAADPEVMALVTGISRQCRGDIIETGSGITSVLMAMANQGLHVHSLEHDKTFAEQTKALAETHGAKNLTVHYSPSKDGCWYDLASIPDHKFALGFCDGPPRMLGTRMMFFEHIAPRCKVIVADDVGTDWRYAAKVTDWVNANNKQMTMLGRAALIR